jgi:hypothetical protein
MKKLIIFTSFLILSMSAFAQESALEKAIIVDTNNDLRVYVPPDALPGWDVPTNWVVVVIDGAKNVSRVEIQSPITTDTERSKFVLRPTAATKGYMSGASKVIVNFGSKVIVISPKPGQAPSVIAPESNKQKTDLYFSVAYSPSVKGSGSQYSVDGSAAVMFDLSKQHQEWGQLGFVGSVKTDKRKKVDPDSYRAFLAYQRVLVSKWWGPGDSIQGAQFTWLAAGAEFDRKGKTVNFITAPYVDFPIRLFPKQIRAGTVPMAILTPSIGFEAGKNFRNTLEPEDGGRAIFRGVVGADFLYRFNPGLPGFKGAEFTTSWVMRTPAKKEIYTLTEQIDGEDVEVPFLNRKPRHYVKSEFGLKLNDYLGISAKYEYGMIPPVFRRVDGKFSIGFTFSAKQTNDGVPSTIRSK